MCQKLSAIRPEIYTKPFTNATLVPMERISMDTIGPLPPSKDGHTYILVIIDCFTRFVELIATKTVNAEECASILLQHIGRYGAPKQILSDNGTQFINNTVSSLLEMAGTQHLRSLANSKEETAIVERANKEVLRHLVPMIYHERIVENWQDYLPMVQRIMNAKVHEVTKVAPAKLLFGPAIDLDSMLYPTETPLAIETLAKITEPIEEMIEQQSKRKRNSHLRPPRQLPTIRVNNLEQLYTAQEELLQFAKDNQINYDNHNIAKRSGNNITEYDVGSYVFVEYPAARYSSAPTKFHSKWRGPLKIIEDQGHSRYLLKDLTTNKEEVVHVTNIKPFLFDENEVDPNSIALGDNREWIVEKIIDHIGSTNNGAKTSELQFKVRWTGLQEKYDRWLPFKELRLNEHLHDYLRSIGKARLIPKNLTIEGSDS
jgi:transposase InsO family protein